LSGFVEEEGEVEMYAYAYAEGRNGPSGEDARTKNRDSEF
jgi:hypothetical protein